MLFLQNSEIIQSKMWMSNVKFEEQLILIVCDTKWLQNHFNSTTDIWYPNRTFYEVFIGQYVTKFVQFIKNKSDYSFSVITAMYEFCHLIKADSILSSSDKNFHR